ncbi:uncharacterized protein LOC119111193 [Pollicipes pollicipes]|uniref:uncharacterized protein LOC119111193 n=1 Tax=Pollicipes pollicipes TaxID=41117 RepID=UPI0018857EC3|nr:uncharacterized protein LOC119111193 [Pollicipes pollicipes]
MMRREQVLGLALLSLISTTMVMPVYAQSAQDHYAARLHRKFISKPNNIKKQGYYPPDVQIIEKEDLGYGPVLGPSGGGPPLGPPESSSSINWGKTLNMALQFIMGAAQAFTSGTQIEKVDSGAEGFSWAKVISIGMQVLLNVLGGGSDPQIEKNDNPTQNAVQGVLATVLGLAMGQDDPASVQVMAKQATELFSVVMNLVEALKTSFSERSLHARSLGQTDYTADAGITAITMLEGVARHALVGDDVCGLKSMCVANRDCMAKTKDGELFCRIGSYAASYITPRTLPMEVFGEAARQGRTGADCDVVYSQCNLI